MAKDEIREAIKEASGIKRIMHRSNYFEPVVERNFTIRPFDNNDDDLLERLDKFRNKEGIKFYFYEEGKFMTRTGIRVKSHSEQVVADALTRLGIKYYYEPIVDYGKYFSFPDFYLPDFGLIYEHFGMDKDEDYQKSMERKKRLYTRKGVKFVFTTSIDEQIIEGILKEKLNIM